MRIARRAVVCFVCALALGAVWAAAAQAEESEWLYDWETFAQQSLSEESASVSGKTMTFIGSEAGVQCKEVSGEQSLYQGGTDLISLEMTGCETLEVPKCKVSKPVVLEGESEREMSGELFYDVISLEGTITITGEGCALSEENAVSGSVAAEVSIEELTSQPLVFSEGFSTAVNESREEEELEPLELSAGSLGAVSVEGTLERALSGAHSGETWHRANFTKLCKIQPQAGQNTCGVSYYPAGTLVTLEKLETTKFRFGAGTATCTGSKMEGVTETNFAAPATGKVEMSFSACTEGMQACTVKPIGGVEFKFSIETGGVGLGRGSFWFTDVKLEMKCGGGANCKYNERHIAGLPTFGGKPAIFATVAAGVRLPAEPGNPMGCWAEALWEPVNPASSIMYEFLPNPVYATWR